ncbi:MAG: hypothetical protein QFB86_02785 [Patescibacteria group bacterium]|nr:hypothetical protein [Patescibacteria group bacterium]
MNPSAPNQPNPPAGGQTAANPNPGYISPAGGEPQQNFNVLQNPDVPQPLPPQAYVQPPASGAMPQPLAPPVPVGGVMPQRPTTISGEMNGAPPKPATNTNSTQNTLQIAEVRDGIVIMNDGSFRSVIMVKSINFDLMSQQEQEAVEYSYQGFLNSLYFPIQIFTRSQKVDLGPYIEKLDKIRTEHDNMLLALLMEDYIGYMDALSEQTNIMDKKFYVIVPFFPVIDAQKALTQSKTFISGISSMFVKKEQHVTINEVDLENAKTELRNRVQAALNGLLQCGIQGLPLDTQELIELYYDSYNPDTATRQQLKNFNELSADIITKGQGSALQPHLQREMQ